MNIRPFIESETDRQKYKVIVLEHKSREEVMSRADYLGARAFGVVYTRRGWAIRVLSSEYIALVKELLPDEAEKLTHQYFELSGVPSNYSKAAVQALIAGWTGAAPVRPLPFVNNSFQSWIVRAPDAPIRNRFLAAFGTLTIEVPKERKSGPAQPV